MIFDVNKLPVLYWNDKTKIEYLQRIIILHSIIYYELNSNCIIDKDYDKLSKQLLELMSNTKKSILEKTQYWYVYKDYDGSTGYYLYHNLSKKDKKYLYLIANNILKQYRIENPNMR